MAVSRRKVLIGAGVGAGVVAAGGAAHFYYDDLPKPPATLQRVGSLPADDPTPGSLHTTRLRRPKAPLIGDAKAPWVVAGAGLAGLAGARHPPLNRP